MPLLKKKGSIVIYTIFILSVLLAVVLSIYYKKHHYNKDNMISKTDFFFDTVITITLYYPDEEYLIEQALSLCEAYEKLWNKNIEESDIARINRAKGTPVKVSDETIFLLQRAIHYSELTEGSFDITMDTVGQLWDFTSNAKGVLPDKHNITQALKHTGYEHIQIKDNFVTLTDSQTQLDFGALAKGYIADKLKSFFVSNNVTSGMIDLGGNLIVIGKKPNQTNYILGIQYPFHAKGEPIICTELHDSSLVTSGVYERCFTYQNKNYHHILDSKTGYPVDNNLLSATIISSSSLEGDALSTSCITLGLEKATQLIESLSGVEAVLVDQDENIHITSGLVIENHMIQRKS